MNRLEALQEAYTLATGKSTLPTGTKLDKLVTLTRKAYRDWQTEPDTEWQSLYTVVSAGSVTATDTFELDTEINFISQEVTDPVRIKKDGQYQTYAVVRPQQLYGLREERAVAKTADNAIRFSHPFRPDDQFIGGSIEVPAIIKLDDLVRDNDEVLVDNPAWLPAKVAALYVLNDSQLNYLYSDLNDLANELMSGMKERNDSSADSYNTGIDYFGALGNVR